MKVLSEAEIKEMFVQVRDYEKSDLQSLVELRHSHEALRSLASDMAQALERMEIHKEQEFSLNIRRTALAKYKAAMGEGEVK